MHSAEEASFWVREHGPAALRILPLARRAEGDQPVQIAVHLEAHIEVDAAGDGFEGSDRGEPHVQGVAGTQQHRLTWARLARRAGGPRPQDPRSPPPAQGPRLDVTVNPAA